MGVGQLRVDRDRLLRDLDRPLREIRQTQERALQVVGGAQGGPCGRVVRVTRGGPLEHVNRPVNRLRAALHQVHHGARAILVRFHRVRFLSLDRRHLAVIQLDVEAMAQLVDDLVLELEDIADSAIDLDGAVQRARGDVDDPCRDPDLLAQSLIAAAHEPRRAQLATHVDGHSLVEIARVARSEMTQRVEDALSTDDGEPPDALGVGHHGLRDPRANPVVGRLPRDVGERQHRHRVGQRWLRADIPGGVGNPPASRAASALDVLPQRPHVDQEVARRLVSVGGRLGHELAHDVFEPRGHVVLETRECGRFAIQDPVDDRRRIVAIEWAPAGERLVEHHAEREQIRARVDDATQRLLRRQIGDGADDRAKPGFDHRLLAGAVGHVETGHLGEPKVEDLDPTPVGQHEVGALDVAVDDPESVRLRQVRRRPAPPRSSTSEIDSGPRRRRSDSGCPSTSSITIKQVVRILADVIGRGDRRRAKQRSGACLFQ